MLCFWIWKSILGRRLVYLLVLRKMRLVIFRVVKAISVFGQVCWFFLLFWFFFRRKVTFLLSFLLKKWVFLLIKTFIFLIFFHFFVKMFAQICQIHLLITSVNFNLIIRTKAITWWFLIATIYFIYKFFYWNVLFLQIALLICLSTTIF